MASMMISGLIPLLQQPGLMLEMEEQHQKLLDFFTNTLPKLVDAELRAEADPNVRTWLDDLNAVAYDVDDIVDDFRYAKLQAEADAESCQNQNGGRVRAGLFLFSCFKISTIKRSEVLQGIENRIRSVVKKIEDLVERMRVLNFQPSQEINIIASAERSQQLIFSSPTEIVGRDKEKKDLVSVLQKSSWKRVELCITGPQGIGKTALVRSVFNDARIGKDLEYVLWVEVGPESNIGKVAKSIIDQVIGKDCCISEGNTDLLKFRFYQELSFKRCIIVVDGVWEVHQQLIEELQLWIDEISEFDISLIVTSNYNIELPNRRFRSYYILEPLMVEDGWNLFCEKAFSDAVTNTCPEILEEMGKEIMVRCGGSPLALNMMGGLMRFKKGPEEWQGVINQLKREVLNDIGAATVEALIKVCYNNLCSQVKQCFAFCSLFPKGHYMDKEVLIKLWMANGLLLPSDGSRSMPLEEKGNIVFNELALRHFFEDVKLVHEDSYGNKYGYHSRVTCKLLNLIHEQAVIAAREFALQIPYLLSTSGDSRVDIPMLLQTNPVVRILLFPDDPFIRNVNCCIVPKKTSLRGLHLHSASFERNLLELKYMKHLRYLDLSGSRIKTLPESTSLLYFLQTLNLSKCLLLYQLPKNMKYMRSLRHLYIHKCPKLKKMPAHLSRLSNLQTLTTYIVGEKIAGTGIDEIKDLHLSGLLELYNLHKVKTTAIAKEADLILKTNLDRLTLCWGSEQLVIPKENNDLVVLEALQPHNQLKVLKIEQYGGNEFSTWLADPMATGLVNLVELHLIRCSQCTTLPTVWKLPSLRVLCLKHMANLTCLSRTDEEGSSEIFFPSLKRLVLVGIKKLERWQEEEEKEEEDEEEEEEEEEGEEGEDGEGGEEEGEEEAGEGEGEEVGEAAGVVGATCSNLKTTFEKVVFTVLDELEITSCPNLKTMPHAPQLKHITATIENYKLLQSVTDLITQKKSLVEEANIAKANDSHNEPFPALGAKVAGRVNKKLRTMRMDSTNSVFMPTALPHSLLGLWRPFKELRYLEIFNCNTLVFWPLEFRYLKMLIRLSIRNCPNLTGILPAQVKMNMSLFPKLQKLEFYGCNSLKQVPYCEILDVLELDECPEVQSVRADNPSVMKILYLSCTSWTSLPSAFRNILVRTLWVSECYSLTSMPDWLADMPFLQNLIINECPLLKELPGGHEWLSSLEKLQISKCPDLEIFCNKEPYSSIISQIGKSIDNPLSTNEDDTAAFAGASTTGAPNTPPTQISALLDETTESLRRRSPVGTSAVYGRENEKNSIIEYLLSDDFNRNNPTVVCIVGESGIGKTSIVHLIYSEERVLDSFDARIFITMPEKCDETRLLNKLIESITGFPCPMTEADLLEDLLIDELSGTKVFVVLDDADNENPCFWNRIVTILNHSSRGSVLLVTTKSKDVAEVMGAMQTYYLDPLSDYWCWKIFWQHISTGLSTNANSDLVEMGKQLVSMCQHNPLGIKVLAGLLVCSKNEESLVEILKTDLWEIFGFDGDTLPILRVGYELLPDNLKKCLHYCSLFPKDYVFAKQQSVRMWMSQGFIIPVEGRQPEEVGLQNFDELLFRGFFRHSPVHDVEEDKFIMHDIIRALATNLSIRKCPPADDALERIFDNCFHFSLNPSKIQMDKIKPLNNSDLQSVLALTRFSLPERINFSILDLTSLTDLFTKCINLRTLDLSCADIVELPISVGMLKQLRYFGVNNTKIRSIPRELCSLVDLQTLEAKDCQHLVELPESMMELKNLRHLDVSKKSGCVKMMNGIGQLTNLQSLAFFCVGSEIPYCSIRELKDLNCLSSCLQIAGLENIRNGLDAKEAALHNKVHLNTLWLHWNDNRICTESEESVRISEEVLNNLKPNPQIAELIIRNYGGNLFPTWMGDPSMLKLVSIILDKCLNCSQFPALGGLPSLRHLSVQKLYHLVRLENTDNQFGSKNTPKFPSLETLNLWEMYNLEELFETSDRDFPCLRTLSINRCPMLKKIPCFFSLLNLCLSCCVKLPYLPNLPSLESLTIDGFQKMKSLELPKDLPALKKMEIRHCKELLLVEGLPELLSLEKLNIVHCPNFDSLKSWKPCHPKSISTTRWFFPKEESESTTHVEHGETSNLAEMLMAEDTYKGI